MLNVADLPDDIAALKAMLISAQAREVRKDERIDRLEKLVAAFKQAAFGRKSEKADPEQFDLALEDLKTAIAAVHAEDQADSPSGKPHPNDTLPWAADQALSFHGWSDEEIITFHMDFLAQKIDACIGVAGSEAFRLKHPNTTRDNIRLVLRLRHLPSPSAEGFTMLIEKRVKSEEMQFRYGYGGDDM